MKRKSIKNTLVSLFLIVFLFFLLSVAVVCLNRLQTPQKVDVEEIIIDEDNLVF